MSPHKISALRNHLRRKLTGQTLSDAHHSVSLSDVLSHSALGGRLRELSDRSVLLAVSDQLLSGVAMIELDGVARRMLLCPPDLDPAHLDELVEQAGIDAVVTDRAERWADRTVTLLVTAQLPLSAAQPVQSERATEWLMLTSGTSGVPKIVAHTLEALTGAIVAEGPARGPAPVWATFYDIRRYGGLQIFLRAVFGGGSLILSNPGEALADHVARLNAGGVTHISGTPSHWRKFLMSGAAAQFSPKYVRLSGETADQAVLDWLKGVFPAALVGHAYASTEAGVGFAVNDGLEGFPAHYVGGSRNGVEMKVVDGSLRIRSNCIAHSYVGSDAASLTDGDGFVDTGDMVELRGNRYFFIGRRGGIINIGGLKVHPEEIEAVINRHPEVWMSRAKSRRSPITGSIVVADVILADGTDSGRGAEIRLQILALCRSQLAAYKVPAVIRFVEALNVTAAGKLARSDA